jgi:hypothetical protein
MPNAPAHIGGLTMRMSRALQYFGSKTEEQRRRERMEKQAVAEAKLRHLRVRAGCRLLRQLHKVSLYCSSRDRQPRSECICVQFVEQLCQAGNHGLLFA